MQKNVAFDVDLAPGDRHCAAKRGEEAAAEQHQRNRDRSFRDDEGNQGRPKRSQVQYCRGYDRMRAAEADVVQGQADHADAEHDRQLRPIANVEQDGGEIAPSVGSHDQHGHGQQQCALGEAHEVGGAQAPRREGGKWQLRGQKRRARKSKYGSPTIVGAACRRRRLRSKFDASAHHIAFAKAASIDVSEASDGSLGARPNRSGSATFSTERVIIVSMITVVPGTAPRCGSACLE